MKKDIRKILIDEWDPILIGDNELLWDEYDEYVSVIFKYLISSKPKYNDLYIMLESFESNIGVSTSDEVKNKVIESIIRVYTEHPAFQVV